MTRAWCFAAAIVGAEMVIAQTIEANDHCLAHEQQLEPSLRTWLHQTR